MFGSSEAFADWLKCFGPISPVAVPVGDAQKILGNKSRSQVYESIGRGELVALKDNSKTLITIASIKAYIARLQPAQIKPPAPRTSPRNMGFRGRPAKRSKARANQTGPEVA
jgi:hypothetical protein